jgi:hypothetical protein
MNFEDLRTDPPGPDAIRPAAWFSWHDDVPRAPRAGDPGDADEPEESKTARAEPADSASNGSTPSIPPERVAALRRWIADGGHNAPDVAEQVARRILDRGDL